MAPSSSYFPYSHDEGGPADKAGGSTPHSDSDGVGSVAYDPNPAHPTAMGKDDSMAFPTEAASKSAGDALVYSPAYDPGSGDVPATAGGFVVDVRTTQDVDYSVPDGKAQASSPHRGLPGQPAK